MAARRARRQGYPAATRSFDLLALALAAWVLLGGYVDGIAHVNGATDDTFFTPFHLLLYTGMLAKGLFLVGAQLRNINRGHSWLQALPRGYLTSLVGVALMAISGSLDFLWHTAFGIEANIEASFSPPHLMGALSTLIFMSGPLRALWGRIEVKRGWAQLFPGHRLGAAGVFDVQPVHAVRPRDLLGGPLHAARGAGRPFHMGSRHDGHGHRAGPADERHASAALAALGAALRRGELPAAGQQHLLMYLLRAADYGGAQGPVILLAALSAGLAGDLLLRRLQRPRIGAGALRLFAFARAFQLLCRLLRHPAAERWHLVEHSHVDGRERAGRRIQPGNELCGRAALTAGRGVNGGQARKPGWQGRCEQRGKLKWLLANDSFPH